MSAAVSAAAVELAPTTPGAPASSRPSRSGVQQTGSCSAAVQQQLADTRTTRRTTTTMSHHSQQQRLNKDHACLLVVDMQEGLFQLARDEDAITMKSNMLAHSELARVFRLPTVLTTSDKKGPNGPLPREIVDMHPKAAYIKRAGEVNPYDNAKFRDAVKQTGKKQVIIGGIPTDVCVTSLALSLMGDGYEVFVNSDACGCIGRRTAEDATDRMRRAGVQVLSLFACACELMRDWRSHPGAKELIPFFDKYLPEYGMLVRAHDAAVKESVPSQ